MAKFGRGAWQANMARITGTFDGDIARITGINAQAEAAAAAAVLAKEREVVESIKWEEKEGGGSLFI